VTRLAVLDFGMGNLRSVAKAIEKAGATVDVVEDVPVNADGLVVPGQGHFGSCVTNLGARTKDIVRWIEDGKPYLGLCLGLQVLFASSEEADAAGLGVLPGTVKRFDGTLKIPHIGWNEVTPVGEQPIFEGIAPGTRFYFVHSYYPSPSEPADVAATTDYGVTFACAAVRDTVVATQFHPEKSGEPGIALLRNFLGMCA